MNDFGEDRPLWDALGHELNEFVDKLNDLFREGSFDRAASQYRVFKENLHWRHVKGQLPRGGLDWALRYLFDGGGKKLPGVRQPDDSPW
jgi:hypothetical protein